MPTPDYPLSPDHTLPGRPARDKDHLADMRRLVGKAYDVDL